MDIRTPALVCAVRPHGEAGAVVRVLTERHGMLAGYVAGARGRHLRPVLIPGNAVEAEARARDLTRLPALRLELTDSRGPWLGEPLPAAAIGWVTALTAAVLPERQPYPALYEALGALLAAICHAPSARGWAVALVGYEALLLRELGYGGEAERPDPADWPATLAAFDRLGPRIERYLLAETRRDVMAARAMLRERLSRMD